MKDPIRQTRAKPWLILLLGLASAEPVKQLAPWLEGVLQSIAVVLGL